MKEKQGLDIYVIYNKPTDYPNNYVVRCQRAVKGGVIPSLECRLANSLEEARRLIPHCLARLDRHPSDVLSIVETWL